MGGIVFLFGVAAFLLAAYSAYSNDRLKVGSGEAGLLGMKGDAFEEPPVSRLPFVPNWRRPVGGVQRNSEQESASREGSRIRSPRSLAGARRSQRR
jgi:hypothetical protein